MAVATTALLEKIYKTRYAAGLTQYLAKQSDIIKLLKNPNDFGGWDWRKTYKTTAVRGSTVFGTALANKSVATPIAANFTRSQDHVVVSVECEAARASKGSENALVSAVEDAMDSAHAEMALSLDALL